MNRRDLFKSACAAAFVAGVGGKASALTVPTVAPPPTPGPRQTLLCNTGWRFHDGDIAMPVLITHDDTYNAAKAGSALGAASASYDDSEWTDVALPHDFASFQPIENGTNVDQGYRRRGIAWYRNSLRFDEADRGKHIELQLDGVATFATIWFNGTLVARNWSGYSSAYVDLTPYVTYGEAFNSLVVRVDASAMEGWWYEGAGIYRDVWIVKRNPVHIRTDGVFAHPVKDDDGWQIPVEVTAYSIRGGEDHVDVTVELWDDEVGLLAREQTDFWVVGLAGGREDITLRYNTPRLWSPDTPNLYRVVTTLSQQGVVIDEVTTTCGFRTQRFDADKGFFLNDQHVKIKGVCLHQDHAGVGTAVPAGVIDYRLRRLKETGCNAIRFSHNAQNKVLMDACDRHGFLIMAENRNFNPSPDYMEQLEWLVRRDRNHPSIYLWSVFNEEPMQGTEAGYEMVRRMSAVVKSLDTSRPVTAAMNNGLFTPLNVSHAVDVVGINYQQDQYDPFHAAHPDKPMFSSEDTSAFMTRGEFKTDPNKHVMACYDDDAAPWGETHRAAWKAIAERDFIAGGFVWTGFDYHGEPTPHTWPTNSSFFGIMDLCGFDKPAADIHRAQWVDNKPVLGLSPHWNWTSGETVRVMACTNCEEVELLVNGTSAGKQKGDRLEMNYWTVPFAAGFIEARAYKAGKVVLTRRVETTGKTVALRLTPDRAILMGDGRDAMPVKVEAVDAKGRVVPQASDKVTFTITGGQIIGLGNGDPNCLEAEKGNMRSLFHGLAQVIVQTPNNGHGNLTISASAPGLKAGTVSIRLGDAAAPAAQATAPSVQKIGGWFRAPAGTAPSAALDYSTWRWFNTGELAGAPSKDGVELVAAKVSPFASIQKNGGIVEFLDVTGACDIYIDGVKAGSKDYAEPGKVRIPLTPGGERTVAVQFRTVTGQAWGLPKDVRIRP